MGNKWSTEDASSKKAITDMLFDGDSCFHAADIILSMHAAVAETYDLVPGSKGLVALMRAFSTAASYHPRRYKTALKDACVAIGDESGLFDFILETLYSQERSGSTERCSESASLLHWVANATPAGSAAMVSCGAAEHLLTWLSRCGWSDHVATMAFGIIAQTARLSTPQLRPRIAGSAALRSLLAATRILLADPAHASTDDLGKAAVHHTCMYAISHVMSVLATAATTAAAPAAVPAATASAATASIAAAAAAAEVRMDYAADLAPFVPLLGAAAAKGDQVGTPAPYAHAALASLFTAALTSAATHTAPLHTTPVHAPTADDARYVTPHNGAAADGAAADDDSLRNDFAAFLLSPAFDGVLRLPLFRGVDNGSLTAVRLLRCAADLDGELCAAVFTAPRVTAIADFVSSSWQQLSALQQALVSGVVARLAAGPAALAARLVSAGLLQGVLAQGLSGAPACGARTEPCA